MRQLALSHLSREAGGGSSHHRGLLLDQRGAELVHDVRALAVLGEVRPCPQCDLVRGISAEDLPTAPKRRPPYLAAVVQLGADRGVFLVVAEIPEVGRRQAKQRAERLADQRAVQEAGSE